MSSLFPDYDFDIKVAKGVASLIQRMVYTDEELVVSLRNSMKQREQEIAERDSLYGRLMALFVGKDPGDYIDIDGMRLKQLSDLAGGKPRQDLVLAGTYRVNLEVFRELLRRAERAVGPFEKGRASQDFLRHDNTQKP